MENKIGTLGLQIPIQYKAKSNLDMDPDAIKLWRAALPMADTGATAKKLYAKLTELNQVILEPEKKFAVLELLRPPLQLVCQALKKHYIDQTTAINTQKLTIANLAQTLQQEAANGYKTVLEELEVNRPTLKATISPIAIYRIMHYYSMILLRCYQLYLSAPERIWHELHLLYTYARQQHFLNNELENINTSYIQILLLAASNPWQWRQHEQELINNALSSWAPMAILRNSLAADQQAPGSFIIDVTKDLPPSPIGLQQLELTADCLTLSVTNICPRLQTILTDLTKDEIKARSANERNPEYLISASTLQRLTSYWNSCVTEKHKRFHVSGAMQVIFGLSATHHYMGGEQPFEANDNLEQCNTFNKIDTLELTEELATESSEQEANLITDYLNNAYDKDKPSSEKFSIYTCTLVNISPTGSCLQWADKGFPLVQPGEIIAMRTKDNTTADNHHTIPWNIGVIRWLKYTVDNKLKLGIQLLAPYANSAGAQILKDDTPTGYFLRCLILPQMADLAPNPTIITPILPFKEGKFINLYQGANATTTKVKLTKQVDASSNYRQFEYSSEQNINIVKQQEISKPIVNKQNIAKTNNLSADDKFNSIWDKL